jgi:multidrug resistance efflux pump
MSVQSFQEQMQEIFAAMKEINRKVKIAKITVSRNEAVVESSRQRVSQLSDEYERKYAALCQMQSTPQHQTYDMDRVLQDLKEQIRAEQHSGQLKAEKLVKCRHRLHCLEGQYDQQELRLMELRGTCKHGLFGGETLLQRRYRDSEDSDVEYTQRLCPR